MRSFLLTRPLRDVTIFFTACDRRSLFLLTRPLRDVTETRQLLKYTIQFLLTRPLRDVTDSSLLPNTNAYNFYSHAPYGT